MTTKNLGKKLMAGVISLAFACSLLPVSALAGGGTSTPAIDISSGDLVLDGTESGTCPGHEVTGTSTTSTIQITGGEHIITLADVNITAGTAALSIADGADLTLIIKSGSNNTFTSGNYQAGIHVPEGATLTIEGDGADNSGILKANGDEKGAGIGAGGVSYGDGYNSGAVIIKGGTVNATGGDYAPGIGGGGSDAYQAKGGDNGTVTISGGTVVATGGERCTGIGGGVGGGMSSENGKDGTITINEGSVTSTGDGNGLGNGFGALSSNSSGDNILTINGGELTVIPGDGSYGICMDELYMNGGKVTATCGYEAAISITTVPICATGFGLTSGAWYASTSTYETLNGTASYTVTFDLKNGGTFWYEELKTLGNVKAGITIPAPFNPSPKDYNKPFGGWYKDAAYTQKWDFDTDTVTKNTTLYAKWGEGEAPEPMIPVTGITGVPTEVKVSETVTLNATVNPSNATNKTITWSLDPDATKNTSGATLAGNKLTTATTGAAVIIATIADGTAVGTNYTKSFNISVVSKVTPPTPTPVSSGNVGFFYPVTAKAGVNGKISPDGLSAVDFGEDITFTVTPNEGYVVDLVLVDGEPVTLSDGKFIIKEVTDLHTIEVTFKLEQTPVVTHYTPSTSNPHTGDSSPLCALLLLLGGAVVLVVFGRRLRGDTK